MSRGELPGPGGMRELPPPVESGEVSVDNHEDGGVEVIGGDEGNDNPKVIAIIEAANAAQPGEIRDAIDDLEAYFDSLDANTDGGAAVLEARFSPYDEEEEDDVSVDDFAERGDGVKSNERGSGLEEGDLNMWGVEEGDDGSIEVSDIDEELDDITDGNVGSGGSGGFSSGTSSGGGGRRGKKGHGGGFLGGLNWSREPWERESIRQVWKFVSVDVPNVVSNLLEKIRVKLFSNEWFDAPLNKLFGVSKREKEVKDNSEKSTEYGVGSYKEGTSHDIDNKKSKNGSKEDKNRNGKGNGKRRRRGNKAA